jgi:hypothetical protein
MVVLRMSYYVAQAGFELAIHLPQPPGCWDYTCATMPNPRLNCYYLSHINV